MAHSKRRTSGVIERTSTEHEAIRVSLAAFEVALDKPPAADDGAWRAHLVPRTRSLLRGLEGHRLSAEGAGGVFGEVEVALGHGHGLTTARRLHRSAEQQAKDLLDALMAEGGDASHAALRKRGRRLVSTLLRHHELEADLLLATFDQDIGAVD